MRKSTEHDGGAAAGSTPSLQASAAEPENGGASPGAAADVTDLSLENAGGPAQWLIDAVSAAIERERLATGKTAADAADGGAAVAH
jgi:hypothetical protein